MPTPSSAAAPSTTSDGESTTTVLRAREGKLLIPECDDGGSCIIEFVLDNGIFYAPLCATVRPSSVTKTVIGNGYLSGEQVSVNAIGGVPTDAVVAVSGHGAGCAERTSDSRWWFAIAAGAPDSFFTQALCDAGDLTEAERRTEGC